MNRLGKGAIAVLGLGLLVVIFGSGLRVGGGHGAGTNQAFSLNLSAEADPPESPWGLVSTEYANEVPQVGDWLNWLIYTDPTTLNPIISSDEYAFIIQNYIFDTLVTFSLDKIEAIPRLCESYEVSPDGLIYTFHLRHGVTWHDGHPFTAEDVIYSWERLFDPKVDAAQSRNYYANVKSCEALDEYTVRFTCHTPYFRSLIIIGLMSIAPKHVFDDGQDFNSHPAGRHPIGTGPYKFERWEQGLEIVLVRNDDYWGFKTKDPYFSKRDYFRKVVFRIITDEKVALTVLRKGELDRMGLSASQWLKQTVDQDFLAKFRKLKYYPKEGTGYSYIAWNMRGRPGEQQAGVEPLFSDVRVRRAMTYLLNRQMLAQKISYGLMQVTSGPFDPRDDKSDPNIQPLPFDPDKASALLAEAGWADHDDDGWLDKGGRRFAFELTIVGGSPGDFSDKMSTIYKEDLKDVGIDMTIHPLEWTVFIKNLDERNFDGISLGWGTSLDSDPYQIWHSSQWEHKGSNVCGFADPEADRLMEEARRTLDRDQRTAMYRRVHQIIHEAQPYTFIGTQPYLRVVDRRLANIIIHPFDVDAEEWFTPANQVRYK